MGRARLIAPMRPDKYLRIAAAMQRERMNVTSEFASAAQHCPVRRGLIDELGALTFRQIDERADALAAVLQAVGGTTLTRRKLGAEATLQLIDVTMPRGWPWLR
jgi:acyl-CoA synthetase (AMP-forming)/AMP-acid ligase II